MAGGARAADGAWPGGVWDGVVDRPDDGTLPVTLRPAAATLDLPTENVVGLKLRLSHTGAVLVAALTDGSGRLNLRLAQDGRSLAGAFIRQGLAMGARFTRRAEDAPDPVPARVQLPRPPFPYDVRGVTFAGAGGVVLAGTLTVPRGAANSAVLLVADGPRDRDELEAGHRPFWVLADALTRAGAAVLRYDSRGVGMSGGSVRDAALGVLAADAAAALDVLRQNTPGVTVGMVGHGLGGWIAAAVADHVPAVGKLVLLAPFAATGRALMRAGIANSVLDAAADGAPEAAQGQVVRLLTEAGMDAAHAAALAAQLTTPAARSLLAADPAPALQAVRAKTLVLLGGRDGAVGDAAPLLRREMKTAEIVVLPGLNHGLQPVPSAGADPMGVAVTMDPDALRRVVGFLT